MNDITQKLCDGLKRLADLPATSPTLPRRVLVVDDDGDDARLMQTALAGIGCEAMVAKTGEVAERLVMDARPFSRIFLDLSFPAGKGGVDILASIRAMAPLTPITIVTGFSSPELQGAAAAIRCQVIDKFTEVEKFRDALIKAMG